MKYKTIIYFLFIILLTALFHEIFNEKIIEGINQPNATDLLSNLDGIQTKINNFNPKLNATLSNILKINLDDKFYKDTVNNNTLESLEKYQKIVDRINNNPSSRDSSILSVLLSIGKYSDMTNLDALSKTVSDMNDTINSGLSSNVSKFDKSDTIYFNILNNNTPGIDFSTPILKFKGLNNQVKKDIKNNVYISTPP